MKRLVLLGAGHAHVKVLAARAVVALPGSTEHALPVRPVERFIAAWPALVDRIYGHAGRFELVILGAGPAEGGRA
jgi:NADH dehydrogenase FAD-containing subunit